MSSPISEFDDVIRARRTTMLVDREREIPRTMIDELCELAIWAPCHKKTWPWRFTAFTGDARRRLGEAFVSDMVAAEVGDEAQRTKTASKYTRTPNILVIASAAHPDPKLDAENRDAVAAAVQTLLLAATARGIATFWSTPPMPEGRHALELCGFEPDDRIIAVLYMGYPTRPVEAPARPLPTVRHLS